MSIEIEVLNGDASWSMAEPLLKAVWPRRVVEKLPWAGIVSAEANLRVLVQSDSGGGISPVRILRRGRASSTYAACLGDHAPAWTLFALVGAAITVFGLGTAVSIRLTRWGK